AVVRGGLPRGSDQGQPARRQGRGRGGHGGGAPRADQRGERRAGPAGRPPPRHAGHARARLAGHPGREEEVAGVSAQPPFFIPDGDRFVSTESTRGRWSRDYQHGGPPAALLTRALERVAGDGVLLTRVTFDFVRPVPIAMLAVRAEVARAGGKVRRLQATLSTADGTALVHASA